VFHNFVNNKILDINTTEMSRSHLVTDSVPTPLHNGHNTLEINTLFAEKMTKFTSRALFSVQENGSLEKYSV
jgi:hypothetical protein